MITDLCNMACAVHEANEKALLICQEIQDQYFDQRNPDPKMLAWAYNRYSTYMGIVSDYLFQTTQQIEKLQAELVQLNTNTKK